MLFFDPYKNVNPAEEFSLFLSNYW